MKSKSVKKESLNWFFNADGVLEKNQRPTHLRSHPAFKGKPEPQYKTKPSKILTAKNEFMEGTAFYELKDGIWRLSSYSATLTFLKGKSPAEAKLELLRRGFEYYWY